MFRATVCVLPVISLVSAMIPRAAAASCTVSVGYRTTEIAGRVVALWLVAAYGIAFFDRYLKGQPASILDHHKSLEIAEFLSK